MIKTFTEKLEGRSGDFHCYVDCTPWNLCVNIYFLRKTYSNASIVQWSGDKWVESDIKEGYTQQKPSLSLPMDMWQSLLKCTADVLPDEQKEHNAGELIATKRHLEDMRSLLAMDSSKNMMSIKRCSVRRPKFTNLNSSNDQQKKSR